MKKIYTALSAFLFITSLNAQPWQKLNVATVNDGQPTSVAVHQGVLYTNRYWTGLHKSIDNGLTWTPIATTGDYYSQTNHQLASTGSRMYALRGTNGTGDVSYSTDGINWVLDTAGLAQSAVWNIYKADIHKVFGWNGHLMLIQNVPDGFYYKAETDGAWMHSAFLAANEPANFVNIGDQLIAACAGPDAHGIAVSNDFGETWSTPACNGVPQWFIPRHIARDGNTLFLGGVDATTQQRDVYKSTDMGDNWTLTTASTYLTTGLLGLQNIGNLYASQGKLWMMPTTTSYDVIPDAYVSTNSGQTFSNQNAGLDTVPYFNYFTQLAEHNGYLFGLMSSNDLYRTEIGATGVKSLSPFKSITVYPNPTAETIHIRTTAQNLSQTVQIIDAFGRLVLFGNLTGNNSFDVATLPTGVYQLIATDGVEMYRASFVKE